MMRQLVKHDVLKLVAGIAAILLLAASAFAAPAKLDEQNRLYAMVPKAIIYPGETVAAEQVRRVEVTNPNLRGGYAQGFNQVVGMVTTRTLLPDHAIYVNDLREPFAVSRGSQVKLLYDAGNLQITALGLPLQDGGIGDVIRVRNSDSGLTVTGTIVGKGLVQVVTK
jgi:flagellar basal body P-ring formation protein FlgA